MRGWGTILWCNWLHHSVRKDAVQENMWVRNPVFSVFLKLKQPKNIILFYSFCGETDNSVTSGTQNTDPQHSSGSIKCVDKNAFCNAQFCSTWSKAQTDCMKTCNPACQPKPKPTKRPRPTRTTKPRTPKPVRYKPTKPPKFNKNVLQNSPCQDNAQYAAYCRGAFMQCSSLVGKMYCMRTCGMCTEIDKMFICKDEYPDLCPTAYCGSILAQQYCKKSCGKCIKPQQYSRQVQSNIKQSQKVSKQNNQQQQATNKNYQQVANRKPQTTRKPLTTRRTTTRRPTTRRTTTTRSPPQQTTPSNNCFDNPNYAHVCQSHAIDCTSVIIAAECKETCGFCRSQCPVGYLEQNYKCVDEDECLNNPCQVLYLRVE